MILFDCLIQLKRFAIFTEEKLFQIWIYYMFFKRITGRVIELEILSKPVFLSDRLSLVFFENLECVHNLKGIKYYDVL